MTKEFKVDKLGFYRTIGKRTALVDEKFKRGDGSMGFSGRVRYGDFCVWDENGKSSQPHYSFLVEFIAPFDVWEHEKKPTV